MFTSIGADWYGFVHGMTTSRIKANGTTVQAEIIGLLPSTPDEDTIAGEIGLSMPIFGKQGDAPGALPLERVETFALFEQWFAALRSGDADQVSALYADRIQAALFDPLEGQVVIARGKKAIREHFHRQFAAYRAPTIDLVLRLIDRWYIMAELLWKVRESAGDKIWFRTADIVVPTPENEIVSQLGIGTRRTRGHQQQEIGMSGRSRA
jgi:ketosteroid isomerase-like protein